MAKSRPGHNSPQGNGKKNGNQGNVNRPAGKPVRSQGANAPVMGGKRPAGAQQRPQGTQIQGTKGPAPAAMPSGNQTRPQAGMKPSNRNVQMNGKKRVNPANGQAPVPQGNTLQRKPVQQGNAVPQQKRPVQPVNKNAVQNGNVKPSRVSRDNRKKKQKMPGHGVSKQDPVKKSNLPYPEDYVAKKDTPVNIPVQGKDGKVRRKLTPEEKRKRYEKLAELEQAKIEGKSAERKNPSQKGAQNRAAKNGILGLIVVAAGLLVLTFVVHHLYDYIAEKPRFAFVTMGTVEHSIGAKALVVRDEVVIISEKAGDLVTQITEGSRVAKDQALAMVVPDSMKSVVTDLRNVQAQISDVQQELILSGDVPEADAIYRRYNVNLSSLMDSVRFDAMNGNLTNAATYGASLNVVIEEREDEMSKISFNDDRLKILRDDEKLYSSQLQRDATVINANKPGIVSFRLDGNEGAIEYSQFLNMPLNDIRKLLNDSKGAITSDLYVKEGKGAVRIAQNESQYLTVNLSKNDAAMSDFAVGTKHDINVRSEGITIDDCEVVRCEEDSSGMLITFKTARAVESLLDRRTVEIEIVITESSGMRASIASLVDVDYAPKGTSAFAVYIAPNKGASVTSFENGSLFNVNVLPVAGKADENGQVPKRNPINIAGCTVIRTETLSDGGFIVAFTTPNEFGDLLRLSRLAPDGFAAAFVNSSSGLGATIDVGVNKTTGKLNSDVMFTKYSGIASLYTNNQGFVEPVRVILLDNDREFAIIDRAGVSKVPDLNTVIITNPKTVKPGDKVD